jgi:hypothetical protein
MEIFSVGLCIFMRFFFIKYLAKETSVSNTIFVVFLSFTILAVGADLLAYKPTWSYWRLGFHVVAITGFALSGIFTSFSLKSIDAQTLTPYQDSVHSLSFWIFLFTILIRIILFCFQFWLSLKRTMTFRDLLFMNNQ